MQASQGFVEFVRDASVQVDRQVVRGRDGFEGTGGADGDGIDGFGVARYFAARRDRVKQKCMPESIIEPIREGGWI